MTTNEFLESIRLTFEAAKEIVKNKNQDYAGLDDPFRNFRNSEAVGVDLARAILVRKMDKITRVSNLLDKPAVVTNEKLEDTLIDDINYSAILLAYLESKK